MGMYGYVWVCFGMYGYVWVCMGMYGYLDVVFLAPYFSIVVDVGSYIIGGPTSTIGMYGYGYVCTLQNITIVYFTILYCIVLQC